MNNDAMMRKGSTMITVPKITLTGYGILNTATNYWSKGGCRMNWGKTPKIWRKIEHLKNHLNLMVQHSYRDSKILISTRYKDSVVIDISTGQVYPLKIDDFLNDVANREIAKLSVYPQHHSMTIVEGLW